MFILSQTAVSTERFAEEKMYVTRKRDINAGYRVENVLSVMNCARILLMHLARWKRKLPMSVITVRSRSAACLTNICTMLSMHTKSIKKSYMKPEKELI